jgi:hypothetical protein
MGRSRDPRWRELVGHWKRSGLSSREFAPRVGINPRTLERWNYELGRQARRERETALPPSWKSGARAVSTSGSRWSSVAAGACEFRRPSAGMRSGDLSPFSRWGRDPGRRANLPVHGAGGHAVWLRWAITEGSDFKPGSAPSDAAPDDGRASSRGPRSGVTSTTRRGPRRAVRPGGERRWRASGAALGGGGGGRSSRCAGRGRRGDLRRDPADALLHRHSAWLRPGGCQSSVLHLYSKHADPGVTRRLVRSPENPPNS